MGDTIIRCSEHLQNFTLMDNTCLKTPTLSMQAMGLFAYLMTLPNDWVIYKSELVNHFSNGRDAVYKAFNELIDNGFITFKEVKNEKNQFQSYEYYIHEQPVSEKKRSIRKSRNKDAEEVANGKPETGKPVTGIPYTGNPSLLSTNKPSTDNTNKISSDKPKKEKARKQKQPRKTAEEKHNEYLATLSVEEYNKSKECAQVLTDYLIPRQPTLVPEKNFKCWQVDFAKFSKSKNIKLNDILNIIHYAFISKWQDYTFSAKNIIENYDKMYQQMNSSKFNSGNSSFKQVYTDEEYRQMSDDLDSVPF